LPFLSIPAVVTSGVTNFAPSTLTPWGVTLTDHVESFAGVDFTLIVPPPVVTVRSDGEMLISFPVVVAELAGSTPATGETPIATIPTIAESTT